MLARIDTYFHVGGQIGAETLLDRCYAAWGGEYFVSQFIIVFGCS